MFLAKGWNDYKLLDTGDGEKLENWNGYILRRPDPQAIWKKEKPDLWSTADACYVRSNTGGGGWEYNRKLPQSWTVSYENLNFIVRPTGFKHTGLFPEQAANWVFMADKIKKAERSISVLNLFAYTGAATIACVSAGAHVTHVDAAKSMVTWAKENAAASKLADKPQRYIVDDCLKFVFRELRRGNRYDAILMDPPSYGRGADGQVWKMEENIYELVEESAKLLSDNPLFFIINSYTTGLSPSVTKNMLELTVGKMHKGITQADELGLPVKGFQTGIAMRVYREVVCLKIKILYEDNHIIVAEKPFNMPSQEDASKDRDILSELKEYIKQKYDKTGNVYLGLLHRLDRPAGGAMVFARTSKAASRLSEAIQKGEVQKVYYAVLQKKPPKIEDELHGYMVKDTQNNISRMAGENEPGAKSARLKYLVIEEKQGLTLAKIDLYTGRPHQIRVQMKSIGSPLLGDMRYGSGEEKRQLALWAYSLTFEHPVKKEKLCIIAEPPNTYPWNLFFQKL